MKIGSSCLFRNLLKVWRKIRKAANGNDERAMLPGAVGLAQGGGEGRLLKLRP
ncbi:hypothetical protein [Polaromonas sp.]|jgi:hypothetical protein|uniref:hypothetical protein n=1 Tax=Polaromonas sp. TaxID=1869339 RepID=UPI002C40CC52|nr:hypothetical protein [Polaromonas sp.]HQS30618.1 hypothetical protein [Polaromonas sp.]HQS90020.1 hypothetical protein [Polaromonas sp.]